MSGFEGKLPVRWTSLLRPEIAKSRLYQNANITLEVT